LDRDLDSLERKNFQEHLVGRPWQSLAVKNDLALVGVFLYCTVRAGGSPFLAL
jgi:hypothetical protein